MAAVDDDDEFFGSDDDAKDSKPDSTPAPTLSTEPGKLSQQEQGAPALGSSSTLPQLSANKLSREVVTETTSIRSGEVATDFKKLMPITLEQQKKKNQIGDQTIAERADESEEDEDNKKAGEPGSDSQNQLNEQKAVSGYRSRLQKITRLADESTQEHR